MNKHYCLTLSLRIKKKFGHFGCQLPSLPPPGVHICGSGFAPHAATHRPDPKENLIDLLQIVLCPIQAPHDPRKPRATLQLCQNEIRSKPTCFVSSSLRDQESSLHATAWSDNADVGVISGFATSFTAGQCTGPLWSIDFSPGHNCGPFESTCTQPNLSLVRFWVALMNIRIPN